MVLRIFLGEDFLGEECDTGFERCLRMDSTPSKLRHIVGAYAVGDSYLFGSINVSMVTGVREQHKVLQTGRTSVSRLFGYKPGGSQSRREGF